MKHRGREVRIARLVRGRRGAAVALISALFFGAFALMSPLGAVTTDFTAFAAPISGATDVASNFPTAGFGPAGILQDGKNFFAYDQANGRLYRFPVTGGNAATATSAAVPFNYGIALAGGTYYGTSGNGARTFNPITLAAGPPLTFDVGCGTAALVADPLSTSLFVSSFCGIYRIDNPLSAAPIVTQISPTNDFYDGLTITSDGQHLWGSEYFIGNVVELSRTGTIQNTIFIGASNPDGLAVVGSNAAMGGVNVSNNVFVNDSDGTVKRIDTNSANAVSSVASGGTRGDHATVGPDGCLYVTQSDRVEKLAPCVVHPNVARGNIFETTFTGCNTLHVGYNRFVNGAVVHWSVTSNGFGTVDSGRFTAIGGGKLGSKTYHFLDIPLATTLHSEPVQSHIHMTWAAGGRYYATRDPGC